MITVCPSCGKLKDFTLEKGQWICRSCGFRRPMVNPPLVVLLGPAASGKTSVAECLQQQTDWIVFDADLLLPVLPGQQHRWLQQWLTLCLEAGQCGRPVVLCGNFTPGKLRQCSRLQGFSPVQIFYLYADGATLDRRQANRPAWRHCNRLHRLLDRRKYTGTQMRGIPSLNTAALSTESCADRIRQAVDGSRNPSPYHPQ